MPSRALFSVCTFGLGLSIATAQAPIGTLETLSNRFTAIEASDSSQVEAAGAMAHAARALGTAEATEGSTHERALRIAAAAMNLAREQALAAAQEQEILESQRLVNEAEGAVDFARGRADRAEQALSVLSDQSTVSP